LDEVGDMSLKTQAKVLRALEEQRFEPVGAAANKHLEEEIERGNFREDLFYRLNVIPFWVPPLRERREDIPLLVNYFLHEFTAAYGRKPKELTPEAYQALQDYSWPGNVRELRNLIERRPAPPTSASTSCANSKNPAATSPAPPRPWAWSAATCIGR
jgi:two-component system nitrogen regulation response regulator NtrX